MKKVVKVLIATLRIRVCDFDLPDEEIARRLDNLNGRNHHGVAYDCLTYTCRPGHIEIEEMDGTDWGGKEYTWRQLIRLIREELKGENDMNGQMEMQETFNMNVVQTAVLREHLETRIRMHIGAAAQNLIEVGRCLNEAKAKGVVPHGEWEAWVRQNTGMDERKAQRLMQAAREVPEGSLMERLPITKTLQILQLPEGQREAMAEKADKESLTVKQLREAVDRERTRGDQLMNKYNQAIKEKQGLQNIVDDAEQAIRQTEENAKEEIENAQAEVADLKRQLRDALDVLNRRNGGISPKAQEEIDRLRAALAESEEYAAEQARLRQEAQQEALNAAMCEHEPAPMTFGYEELAAATRMFLGEVGVLPHMGYELSRLEAPERAAIRGQIDMIIGWCDGALSALNTVPAVLAEVR